MRTDITPVVSIDKLRESFPDLELKPCFHMSDSSFESGTKAVYGKSIELLESSNDTTHEYTKIDGVVEEWYEDDLEKAIEDGDIECWKAHIVLNDLVRRGALPAGDYFIRVCW